MKSKSETIKEMGYGKNEAADYQQSIPKASGQYSNSENRPVSKNTLVKEMGYSKDEAADYQQMAKNPEIVRKADGRHATTAQEGAGAVFKTLTWKS